MIDDPRTPEEWAEWKKEFDANLLIVSAFLNRYARGCKRCGTTEAKLYGAYTPKTHHSIATYRSPAKEMILCGREDFATNLLDAMKAEILCARCARQVPQNGGWSDIMEARRLEEVRQKELRGMGFILETDKEKTNG